MWVKWIILDWIILFEDNDFYNSNLWLFIFINWKKEKKLKFYLWLQNHEQWNGFEWSKPREFSSMTNKIVYSLKSNIVYLFILFLWFECELERLQFDNRKFKLAKKSFFSFLHFSRTGPETFKNILDIFIDFSGFLFGEFV